jgi:hypothetical protein
MLALRVRERDGAFHAEEKVGDTLNLWMSFFISDEGLHYFTAQGFSRVEDADLMLTRRKELKTLVLPGRKR